MIASSPVRPLAIVLALALLPGADWTRFRGPNGNGIADDKDVPVKWDDKEILWKTPLPGGGHSSPIVVRGKVYLQSATKSERLLVCLDAVSGKLLWRKSVPGGVGATHARSSLASCTPCSDGERVYCVFWDGKRVALFAYDLAGEQVWKRDLGAFTSQHGPGFSPIVHGARIFVNNDQDGSAVLQAFHARDGKPAWEVKRQAFFTCYSTPFLDSQGASGTELIVTSTGGISGYNPADGTEMWKLTWAHPLRPLRTVGSSVRADGLVIATSGGGDGARDMIAVKLGGKGDVSKTHLVWEKNNAATPYVPSVLAHDGHVYGINDEGVAFCWQTRSGKEMWKARLGEMVSASPVLIDGNIFAVGEKGNVFVYPASPAGFKRLAKNRLGEQIYASPAVSNGRLYIRGAKHLFCIGKPGVP
jgi:outer membrane protein assembly factor BamB